MPEWPTEGVSESAAGGRAQALTPDSIEAVLADFRAWLQEAAAAGTVNHAPPEPEGEPVDLHTLVSQFVALRHEVHLQTKAARAQQEQSAEALRQLGQAVDALRQAPRPDGDEAVRPLLKTLIDLHDALSLASREVQRVSEAMEPLLGQVSTEPAPAAPKPPAEPTPAPSFWGRLFGRQQEADTIGLLRRELAAERERFEAGRRQGREAAERVRQFLESLIGGYTMSLQRLERALQQSGLEAIPAAGQPFDPELMEVVEAANGTGRPPGEVLEEVRRGYLWRGRVFRYAQVRVARS